MATRAQQQRAARMTPGEKAAASIRKGECDEGIAEIVAAIQARVMEGNVALQWRVQLDDIDVSEEELTLDEAFKLEKVLGISWGAIEPLASAEHASALLRVLYERDLSPEAAAERMKTLTVKQVMGAISRETEVNPPKG